MEAASAVRIRESWCERKHVHAVTIDVTPNGE
jgi:hypothetical protein